MKKVHPTEEFERRVIDGAAYFTAFARKGPHTRMKADECPTLADAEEKAQAFADCLGRSALVYAVDQEGRSALVSTISPEK